MSGRELLCRDHALQFRGQLQQAEGVGDGSPLFAGLLADLVVAEAKFARHAVEGHGQLDRVQVFALDIFDDGELKDLLIVGGPNDDGDVAAILRLTSLRASGVLRR